MEHVETSVEKQRAVENATIEAQEEENISNQPCSSKIKKRKSKVDQSSTTSRKSKKTNSEESKATTGRKSKKTTGTEKSKDTASENCMGTIYKITKQTKLKNSKETKWTKRVGLILVMIMVSQKVAMKLVFSPRRIVMML